MPVLHELSHLPVVVDPSHATGKASLVAPMAAAAAGTLPRRIQEAVCIMGASLGRFDLEGQLAGLKAVRQYCRKELDNMADNNVLYN